MIYGGNNHEVRRRRVDCIYPASIPHARCFLPSYHLASPFAMKMDEKPKHSVTEAPVTKPDVQVENGQISIPAEEIFVDPAVERSYRK